MTNMTTNIMRIPVDFLPKNIYPVLDCLRDNGGKPRIVGGSIRDYLFGIPVDAIHDFDVATTLTPDESKACLVKAGFNVFEVGLKYGTVMVKNFEITTLRKDTKPNGRHTEVEYIDDFEVDALRRDLTINSLSLCPYTGILYDYCNGYKDLINRRVRFIGNPEDRIKEDYLRILRFLRFTAKYGQGNIDIDCLNACVKCKSHLAQLSRERIFAEMNKLLAIPNAKNIIAIMNNTGLLEIMYPKISNIDSLSLINRIDRINSKYDVCVNYALLFMGIDKDILYEILHDWKFSKKDCTEIQNLCRFYTKYVTQDDLSKENMFYSLWLFGHDPLNYFDLVDCYDFKSLFEKQPPKFPVSSYDLINRGITGIKLGNTLKELMDLWVIYRGDEEIIKKYCETL